MPGWHGSGFTGQASLTPQPLETQDIEALAIMFLRAQVLAWGAGAGEMVTEIESNYAKTRQSSDMSKNKLP